jgi:1,4-dihydroxy-2-naphthoate polyprenyltransferase
MASLSASPALTRREISIRLLLYPSHTLPTAAAPILVAVGLAIHDGIFSLLPVTVAFLASWLIHVGGVFADQYELVRKHPDVPEHPELLDALRAGTLTLFGLRAGIIASFAAAALAAPYLASVVGLPAVLALGTVGTVVSLAYAATPLRYAKHGLADPIFFLMFGVVAVAAAYYVQGSHELPLSAFVVGLPIGALTTNVLLIDDIRDHHWDRLKGWRTGAVRFGIDWNRAELTGLTALAYVLPFWFWSGLGFTAWVLLPLITLPAAIRVMRVVRSSDRFEDLFPMTPRASRLALEYAVLLAIGLSMR